MITSLVTRVVLLKPRRVQENLDRIHETKLVEVTPNLWQITLGVLRMWHRLLFRPETIGTSANGVVRNTRRARWMKQRPFRFPFLVYERAIAPLDLSGLVSSPERVIKHLLGAFHEGLDFVYDFDLLRVHPGALETLRERTRAVVDGTDPRADWLRDLVVFEGYHEDLLAAVDATLTGMDALTPEEANDPDVSFRAYLDWCAAQPTNLPETWQAWRSGEFHLKPTVVQS